jgi:hypothetical protein
LLSVLVGSQPVEAAPDPNLIDERR